MRVPSCQVYCSITITSIWSNVSVSVTNWWMQYQWVRVCVCVCVFECVTVSVCVCVCVWLYVYPIFRIKLSKDWPFTTQPCMMHWEIGGETDVGWSPVTPSPAGSCQTPTSVTVYTTHTPPRLSPESILHTCFAASFQLSVLSWTIFFFLKSDNSLKS